jgi:hypothetical protein
LPAPPPSPAPQKRRFQRVTQKSDKPHPAPQTYIDTLPSTMQLQDPVAEVTYAVEIFNRNARSGGLSNRVHVPAVVTLPPPSDLAADLTGDGVLLTWTSAGESQNVAANSSANSPSLRLRYRIYRRDELSGKDAIAGEIKVGDPGPAKFMDAGFEWEKTYLYRITAVTVIKHPDSEVQVEGDDTPA